MKNKNLRGDYKNKSGETNGNEHAGLKMKLTAKPGSKRRVRRIAETDRSKRVMSPIEAERMNRELYGRETASFHRQSMRSRRLKARRTIALAPAPKPVTAGQNGVSGFFSDFKRVFINHIKKIDFVFLLLILAIGIIGLLAVHSGSMTDIAHKRIDILQIFAFIVGIFAIIILPFIDLDEVLKWWKWIYVANIILLTITLIFGYSPTGEENKSWINLGFTSIQPAEFSKILFIISLSAHLTRIRERINSLQSLLGILLHGGSVIGMVLLERDWGNALVFIIIFVSMIFCAKIDLRYIFICIGACIALFPIIWDNLGEFRKKRVLIGFDPELDPQGYGHQVIRSRNAIASGGLFGQGYLNGETIQRPGALFAQHTDMIFAVIGQEFGFIGCVVLIVLYALLVIKIVSIAGKAGDYAGTYICCGVAGMFIFQFIINIGMALGISPVVGITLPLISYGASSLISMYFALALVMMVYSNSKNYSYKSI